MREHEYMHEQEYEEEETEVMPPEVRLELIRWRHEVLQAEGRL